MTCFPAVRLAMTLCVVLFVAVTCTNRGVAQTDNATADTPTDTPSTPELDAGQEDLDESVVKRIDAETPEQLDAVAKLLESALAKGLSEENAAFANKMLGSIYLQRSEQIAAGIMRSRGRQ